MPDRDNCEAFDLNALPDREDEVIQDDEENVDYQNYKGIYANEDNNQKYQCPETGAHFEYNDLCRRLIKLSEKRKVLEEQIYGKKPQAKVSGISGQQAPNEIFSSSIMSEKIDNHSQNIISNNQKNLQVINV